MRIPLCLTLLMTALLTVACSSAPDETRKEASSSPPREINKSLTVNQRTGSAVVTLVSVTESFQPEHGVAESQSGNFLAIDLKFEGKTGKYTALPGYVLLRKADGKTIAGNDGEGRLALASGQSFGTGPDLVPGATVAGKVAFDAAFEPGASILVTDSEGHLEGEWPLAGGEPRAGNGIPKREINKTVTHKHFSASGLATLVSVAESKGNLRKEGTPKSGGFVIVELKFEGKTGDYAVNTLYLFLKKPDGTTVDTSEGNSSAGVPIRQLLDSGDLRPGKTITGKVAFDAVLQPGTKLVLGDASDGTPVEWPL